MTDRNSTPPVLYRIVLLAAASFGALVLITLVGGAVLRAGVWLWAQVAR